MPPQAANQPGNSSEARRTDKAANAHVIVASNRRPSSFTPRDGGQEITWISVATTPADRAAAENSVDGLITQGMPKGMVARLVTPSRRAFHRYYNIICNPLLWFLHHRSWGFTHTPNIDREAHTAWREGFVNVSQMFADEVVAEAERADGQVAVLLRDYHMHLVGGMVREKIPDAAIHYAPDVPWPNPADWMLLPSDWREATFASLLQCDAIELTSDRDVRSLMSCFEEFVPGPGIKNIDRDRREITLPGGRVARIKFRLPTVDADSLYAVSESGRCSTYVDRFTADDRHTFVTAERTEPHKNIVRCIRAFGTMLDQDRSLAEDARYLIVLAPPPPHLSQYRRYLSEIEAAARDVNKKHQAKAGKPVQLIVENNFPMALAAMTIADTLVAAPIAEAGCATQLSTPLINMNDCNLVLSETSSAAEVFGDTATLVTASDVEAIRREMLRSVEMSDEEREERFAKTEAIAQEQVLGSALTMQVDELVTAAEHR